MQRREGTHSGMITDPELKARRKAKSARQKLNQMERIGSCKRGNGGKKGGSR